MDWKRYKQCILHGGEIYAVLNQLVNHKKKLLLTTFSLFPATGWSCVHPGFWAHGKLSLMSLVNS